MRLPIVASLVALSATTTLASIDRIVLFADSLSDNGNVYKHSGFPPSPPYWKGRFSDGPTWAEHVADAISIPFENIGYAGATTDNADAYSEYNGYVVPGLKQQIETISSKGNSKSLFIIETGYNDLNVINTPQFYNVVNKNYTTEKIAANVVASTKAIIKKYKAKKFVFMSAPPFEKWPFIADADKPRVNKLIEGYNALVKSELKKNIHGVDLKFLDIHGWLNKQLANPEKLGVSTTNGPCIWGLGNTTAPLCAEPTKHFFFDSFHPNSVVHKALANSTLKDLNNWYKIHQ